jgi:hypothetical protein
MAIFIVRVELHNGEISDYDILHALMNGEGFSKRITKNNETFNLPEAEYYIDKDFNIKQIEALVKICANETRKKYEILISETVNISFFNLSKVKD